MCTSWPRQWASSITLLVIGSSGHFTSSVTRAHCSSPASIPILPVIPSGGNVAFGASGVLKLVTFNVLTDVSTAYPLDDLLHSDKRWPAILNILRDADADVIALQEVTLSFLRLLQGERWVQENYFISTDAQMSSHLQWGMGNVIISKFPFSELYDQSYTQDHGIVKSFILAQVPNFHGRKIAFAAVHLKAGTDFAHRRKAQIEETIKILETTGADDSFIVGDLNMRDVVRERNEELDAKFVDLWELAHGPTSVPGQEGYTFDLVKNLFSKAISARVSAFKKTIGSSNRFDRMLIRSTAPVRSQAHTSKQSIYKEENESAKSLNFENENSETQKTLEAAENKSSNLFLSESIKQEGHVLSENKNSTTKSEDKTEIIKGGWVVQQMRMIGTEAIYQADNGQLVWPSDHFGLELTMQYFD